jgi:hypothetical protein
MKKKLGRGKDHKMTERYEKIYLYHVLATRILNSKDSVDLMKVTQSIRAQ